MNHEKNKELTADIKVKRCCAGCFGAANGDCERCRKVKRDEYKETSMYKQICDMCKTNDLTEKDYKFKVKKEVTGGSLDSTLREWMPTKEWVRIHICESCYQKLIKVKG